MRSALKFLLSGLFLLFLVKGNAQVLTITKDYNACLYGLTDKPGHWVVPAKYVKIDPFKSGFAIVMAGSKYGLINCKGVEVIPPTYDYLKRFDNVISTYESNYNTITPRFIEDRNHRILYHATKKSLRGVIDTSGNVVIPIQNFFLSDHLVNGIATFASPAGKGFLDLNGIRGIVPKEFSNFISESMPSRSYVTVLGLTKTGSGLGVLNDSARLIIPCEYDSINFFPGYLGIIEVYKDGKTGYFKKDGSKLFNAMFFIEGAARQKAPSLLINRFTPAFDGKYWGVIKIDGTYMLDFKYEQLVSLPKSYPDYASAPAYKIKENGKWGIITKDGQWILPAQWTDIADRPWLTEVNPPEYFFSVKSGDHWGAVTTSGKQIMPFIYDTIFPLERGLVFWSEEQVDFFSFKSSPTAVLIYDYDPVKDSTNPRYKHQKDNPNPNYIESDMPYEYTDFDDYVNPDESNKHYKYGKYFDNIKQASVTYVLKKETEDPDYSFYTYSRLAGTHWDYATGYYNLEGAPTSDNFEVLVHHTKNHVQSITYLTELTRDNTFIYYTFESTGIIRNDGKIITRPGSFSKVWAESLGYFVVTNSNGYLRGLLNTEGKLVVDTVWKEVRVVGIDTVWVRENRTGKSDCYGDRNLLLIKTGKTLWEKEDQLIQVDYQHWHPGIEATSKGVGLFSTKTMSFVLPPVYKKIYPTPSPSSTYVVENCAGKIGIVNSDGKWQTDSCWTSVFHVAKWEEQGFDSVLGRTTMMREKIILLNDTGWILYDNGGTFERGDPALALRVLKLIQEKNISRSCLDCPWLESTPLPALAAWQSEVYLNAIYRSSTTLELTEKFNAVKSLCPCPSMTRERPRDIYERNPSEKGYVRHTLFFQTDSCLAIKKHVLHDYLITTYTYTNYLLFADGPRIQTLDSLFTGEKWRTVITNETMNFLNAHPGINANCSNPAMYSRIFNESFLLGPSGIVFYPEWQISGFLIPWALLQPYLKQDIANKLNLN